MLRIKVPAAGLLALTIASGILWAQDAPRESSPAATRPEPGPDEERPVDAGAGRESGADRDDERGGSDPFDYEASEQISEDLSVSFPVDI